MSDRELLEFAAKAAGLYLQWPFPDYEIFVDEEEVFCRGMGKSLSWRPLTDSGDAFCLAVNMGISIDIFRDADTVQAFKSEDGVDKFVMVETLTHANARRAIVRAAAEIGRSLP